ncbi:hypothetical protein GCM10010236_09440 [Streptomyces eurythermus]|nr:hypothetical protein GCM10010236_09440 [Streptomyces eurythermus]
MAGSQRQTGPSVRQDGEGGDVAGEQQGPPEAGVGHAGPEPDAFRDGCGLREGEERAVRRRLPPRTAWARAVQDFASVRFACMEIVTMGTAGHRAATR